MVDFEKTPAEIGRLTADLLRTLLKQAAAAARSGEVQTGSTGT